MSKKYAFLLMGKDFNPQRDHACFSAGGVDSYIITVRSPEEAVKKARELTVSYVVCPKDQEEASLQFWGPGKA